MPELNDATITLITQYAIRAAGALALLIAAWIASAWFARVVRRGCDRGGIDLTLSKFFSKTMRWAILVLATSSAPP